MSSPTLGPDRPNDLSGLTVGNHRGFTCQDSWESCHSVIVVGQPVRCNLWGHLQSRTPIVPD